MAVIYFMGQIEKVYYQRNFRIGDFLYENIGVGIILQPGEDAKQALDEAKRLSLEYHNEHLQNELAHQETPSIQTEKVETDYQTVIDEIYKCETITELKGWQKISLSSPQTITAYTTKLKQLKK